MQITTILATILSTLQSIQKPLFFTHPTGSSRDLNNLTQEDLTLHTWLPHSIQQPSNLPSFWRQRRPGHRPCIRGWDSLRLWAGMWNIQHWGQIGRGQHRLQTPAAALELPLCPWLHSADHSMKPTWTRRPPDNPKTYTGLERIAVLLMLFLLLYFLSKPSSQHNWQ